MAAFTKFYVLTADAVFTPTNWRGSWDSTGTTIKVLDGIKDGDQNSALSRAEAVSTNPYRVGIARFISRKLKAQTISGTINPLLGILEANADADYYWRLHAYVTTGDTDTVRGTLLSGYEESAGGGGAEWPTTSTGKRFQAAQTMTSVAVQDGDRLVIEVGYISYNSHTTSRLGTIRYGAMDASASINGPLADLTDGSTSTTTQAGYIEFNTAISLLDPPVHDVCANATVIMGPLNETIDMTTTSREFDEPETCVGIGNALGRYNSVWYQWTPTIDQLGVNVTATIVGGVTTFNTLLMLLTGTCGSFTVVDCAGSTDVDTETLTFDAVAGTTYHFMVGTVFWGGGTLTFDFDGVGGGPAIVLPPAPPTPGATRLLFALEHPIPDPPSYEDGYKTGKLRAVSGITQALSNDDGDYVGTSVEVGLDDKDRQTRLILDDPTIKFLDGSEGTFKMVSETRRRARGTPTDLFRGRVKAYGLTKGLTAKITVEDVLTSEYGPLSARRLISDRKLTRGLFPGLPPEVTGKPQPIIMGEVGDWGATLPLGQAPPLTTSGTPIPTEKGLVPVWPVSTRTINGVDYVEFFLCGHAVSDFDIYAADPTNTFRQLVDPLQYGVTILAPHKPGWQFFNNFFDYVDSDTGFTHRCTTFFILASSIMATSHLAGQITVACSVCGMEDVGDGSGNTITGLFHQWQFLCDNYVFANPGYFSGLYTNVPVWGTTVRMTNSDSFAAMQALSAGWIGGEGYTGGFVLYSLLSREVMRRFAITAFANYFWSRAGQFTVDMFDDTMSIVGLPRYTQPIRLRGGIPSEYSGGPLEGPIFYNYDYDYDLNKYRAPQGKVDDPVARTFTGYIERPVEVDCFFTRHEPTATHAMNRRLLRRRQPLAAVEMPMPLSGLDRELGDVIAITSEDGKGAFGFVDATVRVTSRTYHPKERRVVCGGVVVDDMLGQLALVQTGSAPVSAVLMQTSGVGAAPVTMRSITWVSGNVYYVATTGSNSNPGTLAAPFQTINYALSRLIAGDTLFVRGGTYAEFINWNYATGTDTARITIEAYPGETVILQPTGAAQFYVVLIYGAYYYVDFNGINIDATLTASGAPVKIEETTPGAGDGAGHLTFKNLEVTIGADGVASEGTNSSEIGFQVQGIGWNTFLNVEVHGGGDAGDNAYGMYVSSPNNFILSCDIYDTRVAGVQFFYGPNTAHVHDNVIRRTKIHDVRDAGWGIINVGINTRIENNLIYNNASCDGVQVFGGSTTGTKLWNNTFYNNGGIGINLVAGTASTTVQNNISYLNGGGNYSDGGTGTVASNNLFGIDPLFVNAGAGDFRLQAGSVAINAGMTLTGVPDDFAGVLRPLGAAPDIGAHESA